jgi:hypothetical protein
MCKDNIFWVMGEYARSRQRRLHILQNQLAEEGGRKREMMGTLMYGMR